MDRTRVLVSIIVAMAGVCGILAWQLSIEKARNQEQRQLLHTREVRIVAIERSRAQLETEVKRLLHKAEAVAPPKGLPPSTAAPQLQSTMPESEQLRLRMNMPAMRAMRRTRSKLELWRSYVPLTQELGLSANETDRFFALLVAQQERDEEMWEQNRPTDRASSEQAQLEAKREREAEIEAFLGPEKFQTTGSRE